MNSNCEDSFYWLSYASYEYSKKYTAKENEVITMIENLFPVLDNIHSKEFRLWCRENPDAAGRMFSQFKEEVRKTELVQLEYDKKEEYNRLENARLEEISELRRELNKVKRTAQSAMMEAEDAKFETFRIRSRQILSQ